MNTLPDDMIVSAVHAEYKRRTLPVWLMPAAAACLIIGITAAVYPKLRMQKPPVTEPVVSIMETTGTQMTTDFQALINAPETKTTARSESAVTAKETEMNTEAVRTDITSESGKTAETEAISGQTSDAPSGQTAVMTDDRSGCADNHKYLHWEEMTVDQQYFMAEIGEPPVSYHTAERKVSADEVGAYIGQAYMSGYDWYEMIYYHCETKAYQIKGDDAGRTIAIQFPDDETYYLYSQDVQPLLEQPTG